MLTYSQLSPAAQREYARNQILIEEHEEREAARKSLRAFTKKFWYKVVPAPFVDTWVIGAITEHMQALYEGEIRRLLINIYGRSGKSTIVSVMYPCWVWGLSPSERFLYVASTQKLALRDADFARDVIKCHEYQSLYGNVNLTKDAAGLYLNDKLGSRQSLGAESQITGFGANNKFFDDPNDANEVESPVQRDGVNNRFANFATRSDSFATDKLCVAQQRTHPKDVSGYIDELGLDFVKLIIPLEYKGKTMVTQIGWSDPRTEIGEVADEARFPESAIRELKTLLSYRYEGQANQLPHTPEGRAIRREWFEDGSATKYCMFFQPEDVIAIVLSYDIGFSSAPTSDWTWGSLKAKMRDGTFLTLWQHFGRWTNVPRRGAIATFALQVAAMMREMFPTLEWKLTEEAGIGGSVSVVEEDISYLISRGIPAETAPARKQSKPARAVAWLGSCEAHQTKLYAGAQLEPFGMKDGTNVWIKPFLSEALQLDYSDDGLKFINGHDDMIDPEVEAHYQLTIEYEQGERSARIRQRVKNHQWTR